MSHNVRESRPFDATKSQTVRTATIFYCHWYQFSAFSVQITRVTEAQSGPRLSTLCNQCCADTDRCSIRSTVSGRPHELRLSFKNIALWAYLHDYCPRGTPPTGSAHETSPAGTCSKAAFVWRVCVINIPLLRLNLEPSAADRNVSPSLHIRDARYGTTYIHTYIHTYIPAQLAEGSRLSRTMVH